MMCSTAQGEHQTRRTSASSRDARQITELLRAWRKGDERAAETLAELIYQELHQIAVGHLAHERPNHTLQPTALVHEAFLRLRAVREIDWENRKHFYALASRVIRRILVDYARKAKADKRGGSFPLVPLGDIEGPADEPPRDVLDLNDALSRLRELDELQARIVDYRFFGGLTLDEIAELTETSPSTVQRRWRLARAWLYKELSPVRDDERP
jgi:RNA polymerase sigma-70 factor (ECF subfamily)